MRSRAGLADARTNRALGSLSATVGYGSGSWVGDDWTGTMAVMRRLWGEFKAFAMSGNMLDLALGFIIGAAFAKLIESLANNVLMQLVAAIFGKQDFTKLQVTVHRADINYGAFLTDLINFLMLAAVLFGIVKVIVWMGIGRGRVFGEKQCPYCLDKVPPSALVCRSCGQQLVDELPPLSEAERMLAEMHARRRIALPPLPVLPRRNGDEGGATEVGAAEVGAAAGAAAETLDRVPDGPP
jgi:large conductance mechanosensitive channel